MLPSSSVNSGSLHWKTEPHTREPFSADAAARSSRVESVRARCRGASAAALAGTSLKATITSRRSLHRERRAERHAQESSRRVNGEVFVHRLACPRKGVEAIVVEIDEAAFDQSRVEELERVLDRLVEVDVDRDESERELGDLGKALGDPPWKNVDELERLQQRGDVLEFCAVVLARLFDGNAGVDGAGEISLTELGQPFERVEDLQ